MSAAHSIARYVPRGNLLSPEVFASRHRLLVRILVGHLPVIYLIGLLNGMDPLWAALELTPALAAAGLASIGTGGRQRLRAVVVTAGLSWTSIALVHFSGGSIEAHFHFFIVLGFIALYQDWLPFLWYIGFTLLSHGAGSALSPDLVFNHESAQAYPWLWSGIHAAGVAMLSVGLVIFWSNTEAEQKRATSLATELTARDLERARADIQQRQTQSQMLLNLARRNQSLVQRQLDTIEHLETDEQRPEVLDRLFSLDHMTTRMRRNAESLLVLSGSEPARIWREPLPLSDILRAAISEVEDYQRIDLVLSEDPQVEGRAAADLSHLFAELVENATNFSPPSTRASISAMTSLTGDLVVVVRDRGVGMDAQSLTEARSLLDSGLLDGDADQVMTPGDARLGLQVVGRLARRYGIAVEISTSPTGTGVQVTIPAQLVVLDEPVEPEGQAHPAAEHHLEPATVEPAFDRPARARHGVPSQATGTPGDLWSVPTEQPVQQPVQQPVEQPVEQSPVPVLAAPVEVPALPARRPATNAFAAFTSRQAAPIDHHADHQTDHQTDHQGGLPSLPRRSRDDEVSSPAPVDLWADQDGGDRG
jgi:signal transduction histidine kinase